MDFLTDESKKVAWKNRLGVAGGVGQLIKQLVSSPTPENPLINQMQQLAERVEALGKKVSTNFDEMEALITEINFFVKILSPNFVLMRFLRDCIHYPCQDSIDNFLKAYHENPPLKLTFNLITYLEQESINPLKHEAKSMKIKHSATFRKWERIFTRVLGQSMLIEALAKGLMGDKDTVNIDLIIDASIEIFSLVRKWKKEFKVKGDIYAYWEEMKEFLPKFMETNSTMSNAKKADKIKEKLDTYLTNDAFYVCVFDKAEKKVDYVYHCFHEEDYMITSWEKGDCCAFIYRTTHLTTAEELEWEETEELANKYHRMKDQVENCRSGKLSINGTIDIRKQLIKTHMFNLDDFIALISLDKHPEIRSANSPKHKWGPGWWAKVEVTKNKNSILKYYLIAAFE